MKRSVVAILTVIIALACLQAFRLFGAAGGLPGGAGTPQATAEAPAALPLDQARFISFAFDNASIADLDDADRLEQYRDWMLITAIGALDNAPATLRSALYDLPPVRHDYFRPVANFDFGPLRSRTIGGGTVIALLPADTDPARRANHLPHIADEHRKTQGQLFDRLVPIDYAIDLRTGTATLTRRADITAAELFSDRYGYHEAFVASRDDLAAFLGAVDDITFADVILHVNLPCAGTGPDNLTYLKIDKRPDGFIVHCRHAVRASDNLTDARP